ncbi:hypothetical protein K503DRAFT_803729 [Rhizopogon vinicolor AM-OR11-026]|uniref:Uncharacterized protein n=1 Tax=Rhizopogon vinicolor AM-OR11-026 TaxID=1314800 RepID=A0A1B7MNT3_9AGAM|nr:hypothetical protein K503DRAFT_803729 [Rhizopogon vinicolor AM-OR11-026]
MATQKLAGSLCRTFYFANTNEALAILSQRFALSVCLGHPNVVSYIEKGVASHMRICYSTTDDRSWSYTDYPSEPLLSCPAAQWHHHNHSNLAHALTVLKDKVDGGMFEIGQSGELTSRLLLFIAKDMYVRRDHDISKDAYIRARGPDNDNHWKAELIDCQKAGDAAKELFQPAYINFSHWGTYGWNDFSRARMTDTPLQSGLCATGIGQARSNAIISSLIDKMIPIYFDDPNLGPDDIGRVSQIFISDKAGKYSSKRDLGFISLTHPSIDCLSHLSFIALLLDLNGEPKLNVSFPEMEPHHPETDWCLRIYAPGLSEITFPFLFPYCG